MTEAANKHPKSQATKDWLRLRFSGAGLFVLAIWFVISMAMLAGADYETMIIWVKQPLITVLLVLFMGLIFYHLKLGVHEVIEDYVYDPKTKMIALFVNNAFALVFGLLSIVSILRISLGLAP